MTDTDDEQNWNVLFSTISLAAQKYLWQETLVWRKLQV